MLNTAISESWDLQNSLPDIEEVVCNWAIRRQGNNLNIHEYPNSRFQFDAFSIWKTLFLPYHQEGYGVAINFRKPNYVHEEYLTSVNSIREIFSVPWTYRLIPDSVRRYSKVINIVVMNLNGSDSVPEYFKILEGAPGNTMGNKVMLTYSTGVNVGVVLGKELKQNWQPNPCEVSTVYVIANALSYALLLRIIAALPAFFPGILPYELPYTKSLMEFNWDAFASEFRTWFQEYSKDVEGQRIKNELTSGFRAMHELSIRVVRDQLTRNQREMDDMLSRYMQRLEQRLELSNRIYSMENNTEQNWDEKVTALLKLKSVRFMRATDSLMTAVISSDVFNYDMDSVTRQYNSERTNPINKNPAVKELYKLVFMDCKYTLRFNIGIEFPYRGRIELGHRSSYSGEFGISNPHIERFGCWGSYAPKIEDAFSKGDLYEGLLIIIAAVSNLNFSDSTVVNYFTDQLLTNSEYYRPKCLVDTTTNEKYSVQELLNMIRHPKPKPEPTPESEPVPVPAPEHGLEGEPVIEARRPFRFIQRERLAQDATELPMHNGPINLDELAAQAAANAVTQTEQERVQAIEEFVRNLEVQRRAEPQGIRARMDDIEEAENAAYPMAPEAAGDFDDHDEEDEE